MGILSGVVSYLFGLCLNLLDAAIDGFLGALGFDLDTFESYFPAAKEYYEVIIGFAIGILLIMLIFQIFRNFGVMLDMEAEDPLKMVGKAILFFGMIISSRSIVNIILGLLTDPYAIFLNTVSDPYEFQLLTLATSMFTSVFSNPFMSIVAMILMIVMGWQFLKLTVECVERYIVFYFVLYCAPVVFATGAFKSTAQIFKSWCRMLASQGILLLLNIWSIKLFLSFMPVFVDSDDIIFHFLLGYAFLKFAQKADTLLRILGLNTASTGDMVRSLGGTIAGIAMAIKTATGMAKGVTSAAGKMFGGGDSASTTGGGAGGNGNGGSDVSGMSGGNQPGPGGGQRNGDVGGSGDSGALGGVTSSGIGAAKQNYINDAISSARNQMMGGAEPEGSDGSSRDDELGGQGSQEQHSVVPPDGRDGDDRGGNPNSNITMEPGKTPGSIKNPAKIDAETREGLSNIAHGMPHNQYDPVKKSFSGGGMPEFTGEEANIIGASQFTPSEGFGQSVMKMADGTTGTVYQNQETGEAHVVQFASVDNGVVQGTISEINPSTGQMGEDFAFKAVHNSVPGADSFSASTVPVQDASGGVYHVATGAETSFFSTMSESGNQATVGSAYTPGGTNKMAGMSGGQSGEASTAPASSFTQGPGADSPEASSMSGYNGSPSTPPTSGNNTSPSTASPSGSDTAGGSSVQGFQSGGTFGSRSAGRVSGSDGTRSAGGGRSQGTSVHDETPIPNRSNTESPPVHTGMNPPGNKVSRFSKSNPANVEVFKRDHGSVETFDKSVQGPDAAPTNIGPPQKR